MSNSLFIVSTPRQLHPYFVGGLVFGVPRFEAWIPATRRAVPANRRLRTWRAPSPFPRRRLARSRTIGRRHTGHAKTSACWPAHTPAVLARVLELFWRSVLGMH